jgi:hypothetical protein
MGAMDCLAMDDMHSYNVHLQLFVELLALLHALLCECRGATWANLQCEQLLQVAVGKVPSVPNPPSPPNGDPIKILPEAHANNQHQGPTHKQQPQSISLSNAQQAKRLVKQGLSSQALHSLERGEATEVSTATLEHLQALHLPNPTPQDKGHWPKMPIPKVKAAHLAQVISKLPCGSAPGPSGWTFKMVLTAANQQPTGTVAAFLVGLAQQALHGTLCWRGMLMASRLVALHKPDVGV